MIAALIIVFREVFEAGLIVGIVLAVTHGVARRGLWISAGVAAGVLGSCVMAAFASLISQAFAGAGQELVNATVLSIAVVMLTWHNVWMARHGRELAAEFRAAGQAVAAGAKSLFALAVVVCVAVLREGFEVVMFLYINFAIRERDIRGYIAMLMDMPSLTALQVLLQEFIARQTGAAAPDASA